MTPYDEQEYLTSENFQILESLGNKVAEIFVQLTLKLCIYLGH